MISFHHKGDFNKTFKFFKRISRHNLRRTLEKYGQRGVVALENATPKDTGLTSRSWSYEIEMDNNSTTIHWSNSNIQKGVSIAILIQYGHGTQHGGYIQGYDYINPALRPVFEEMVEEIWREVTMSE
ncbi:MAG: HK97 gp10 family phage protein [Erysipelotrichia bacterium]|nr:HK97 gp10 family phage protein [Erysipelotrichia bacterium]